MRTPRIALIATAPHDAANWLRINGKTPSDYRICCSLDDIRGNIFTAVHATPAAEQMRDYKHLLLLAQMRVVTNAE